MNGLEQENQKKDTMPQVEGTENSSQSSILESTEAGAKQSPVVNAASKKSGGKKKFIFFAVGAVVVVLCVVFFKQKNEDADSLKDQLRSPQVRHAKNAAAPRIITRTQVTKEDIEQAKSEVVKIEQDMENERKLAQASEDDKLNKMRWVAPVQVYTSDGNNINVGGMANKSGKSSDQENKNGGLGDGSSDQNSKFMSSVSNASSTPSASATHIVHPGTTLAQGTIIWATLETRVVSDLPGMIRAITSEDIYSEDGSTILLPRGSKLIGQYNSGITQGQRRVFVVWQRAIRPDHIDIRIDSPGADQLGAAGLKADGVDYHFWEQFGNALLLSIIGASVETVGVNSADQYNSASAYRDAVANSFNDTANDVLDNTGTIKPTIYANQGSKINVFVARDLDFYDELVGGE